MNCLIEFNVKDTPGVAFIKAPLHSFSSLCEMLGEGVMECVVHIRMTLLVVLINREKWNDIDIQNQHWIYELL